MSKYYTLKYTGSSDVKRHEFGSPYVSTKISAIKEHRKFTGSSLKEAKEAIESALEGNTIRMVDNRAEHPKSEEFISDVVVNFRDYGFKMEGSFETNELNNTLRELIKMCLDEDEFDKAVRLIAILKEET